MEEKEALRSHIETSLLKGAPKQDLQKMLLKSGWPEDLIKLYTKKASDKLPETALIKVESISKRFNTNQVVENISFEVRPAEIFGIIGLSGAGKTTLLNLIVGFLHPDAGDVVLELPDGRKISVYKHPELVKKMFGFSTQTPSFYEKLTVEENLAHFGELYGLPSAKIITKTNYLLKLVGLYDSKKALAQNLSGGMQKRLDIACALIHDPKMIVLDEPTADLDPILRVKLWDLIRQINKQGTTIIIASHFIDEIEFLCNRIAILRNKQITEIGTSEDLISIYSKEFELTLETKSREYGYIIKKLERKKLVDKHKYYQDKLILYTKKPRTALNELNKLLGDKKEIVRKIVLSRPSLSEVFEAFVKKK